MDAQTILIALIAILCANYTFDKVLEWLNLRRLDPVLPNELLEFYDKQEYARSQDYLRTRMRFSFLSSTLSFLLVLAVLITGLLGEVDAWLRGYIEDPALLAIAFFGVLFLVLDIVGTPFSLYSTFVIEQRFGFNKTTFGTWFLDKLKGYLLGGLLGGGILYLLVWLIGLMGEEFWLWFWLSVAVLLLAFQFIYATLLLPLFNRLRPLESGDLRSAIEHYCDGVGFPLRNIMVMDGSRRSTKANAFFSGFGPNKRIVLYDTLIQQLSQQELVAVLAHEVGHYKRRHIEQGYVISLLNIGVLLFLLSRLIFEPALSTALGAEQSGIHLGLLAFAMLYAPVSQLVDLLFNAWSRRNEYQADAFAASTYDGNALGNALTKLHVKTLSNLRPHPAYVFTHFSHPTLLQRLAAIRLGGRGARAKNPSVE
ncbi:MAG: M48 family metallopeptidase [Bacteroidota bacterium]